MTEQKPCRRDLLDWINKVSFAMDDILLFLDTHPCNQEALACFEDYKKQRNQAKVNADSIVFVPYSELWRMKKPAAK